MEKSETKKNNKNVILFILVGIIAILLCLLILLSTGTINFKSNSVDNANYGKENENNDTTSIIDSTNETNETPEKQKEQDNQNNNETELTKEEAENIIDTVMKKSFNYIYALSPECGDRNKNDAFEENNQTYEASASYTTLSALKEYLHTFLSDSIINSVEEKYVVDMYKEKNGKLYCLNSGKGCGYIYDDKETNYTVGPFTNDKIEAGGDIVYETCGDEKQAKPVSFTLKKVNSNWILDTFSAKNF